MSDPVRAPASLVPPSVADARGRAFGLAMERALAEPDFRKLLFERIDAVDASVLPALIREFSMEEFVEPDMREEIVRALLKDAFSLHADKGFIHGVRRGLALLGMSVQWEQWFQMKPQGEPGTHRATVYANQFLFDEQDIWLDARLIDAARRMIDGTKRWSQTISFRVGARFADRLAAGGAARGVGLTRAEGAASVPGFRDRVSVAALARGVGMACATGATRLPAFGSRARLGAGLGSVAFLQIRGEASA